MVAESFGPGLIERLGLDQEALREMLGLPVDAVAELRARGVI